MTRPMRRAVVVSFWVALLSVVIACQPAETGNPEASERDAITALRQRLLDAARADDAEAVSRLFTENAAVLPPGQRPVSGRAAIRRWWQETSQESGIPSLEAESFEIVVAGDWAFDRGVYAASRAEAARENPSSREDSPAPHDPSSREARSSREDPAARVHGNYLHLLRRQQDGSWKIARAIWNRLPPISVEDIPRIPRTP